MLQCFACSVLLSFKYKTFQKRKVIYNTYALYIRLNKKNTLSFLLQPVYKVRRIKTNYFPMRAEVYWVSNLFAKKLSGHLSVLLNLNSEFIFTMINLNVPYHLHYI